MGISAYETESIVSGYRIVQVFVAQSFHEFYKKII